MVETVLARFMLRCVPSIEWAPLTHRFQAQTLPNDGQVAVCLQRCVDAQAPAHGGGLIGFGLFLVVAVATGATLGAVGRPEGLAASVSGGLLFGLLAWIAWSLTVLPLLRGSGPTWSVAAAGESFPFL